MKTKVAIKVLAIGLFFALAVIAILVVMPMLDSDTVPEQRGTQSENFASYKRIEYDGKRYVRKNDTTVALLMGIDKTDYAKRNGYRLGGQADFLMVLVIDDSQKTVRVLQIDRDTMTNITILSVLGREVGTSVSQICLSHGFGATEDENNKYTVKAVSELLNGENIDLYISGNIDSIGVFNDALGGVTVTLSDDFSVYDPLMISGTTLTLNGKQAELFVRSRYNISNGTNEMRMARQRVYMDAAKQKMQTLGQANSEFAVEFINAIENTISSDVSTGRIINMLSKVVQYDVQPIEYLDGEHVIGSDGFMEFHVTDEAAIKWVLSAIYKPD